MVLMQAAVMLTGKHFVLLCAGQHKRNVTGLIAQEGWQHPRQAHTAMQVLTTESTVVLLLVFLLLPFLPPCLLALHLAGRACLGISSLTHSLQACTEGRIIAEGDFNTPQITAQPSIKAADVGARFAPPRQPTGPKIDSQALSHTVTPPALTCC